MSRLNVSLVQMCAGMDVDENLQSIERLIENQLPESVDMLLLPEFFASFGSKPLSDSQPDSKQVRQWMAKQAKTHQCWLIGGSVPVMDESDGRSAAACFVYDPDGREVSRYDKIHLFDVDVADETGSYRESDDYLPGSKVEIVDTGAAKLGLSICYDLRFPELYRHLSRAGADILCVPSAFTRVTGEAHWEPLLRARAIENQCYVLASNQGGQHACGRETYGHSMIISPWGEVLVEADVEPTVISAELDLSQLRSIRQQIPCLGHRRL